MLLDFPSRLSRRMASYKLLARQLTGAFENALRFNEGHPEEGFCHRFGIRGDVKGSDFASSKLLNHFDYFLDRFSAVLSST